MVFPTERPATELGNEVALHKTLGNVSLEFHRLVSRALLEIIKALFAAQGFEGENFVLTPEGRQDKMR